jgi:hypothetical protein
MHPSLQPARSTGGVSLRSSAARLALFLAALVCAPFALYAQQPPPNAIGTVEGKDISVEGGSAAGNALPGSGQVTIYVVNGAVVTVHSGQARLTLNAGGLVDICGPAKFTLLQSGTAITLALNFGRMRAQLPAGTSLRIFTPTIIATPLDIGGGPRDVTVGLDLNDSLCVVATSGALRLEQQFTGEGLIVPQAGEFFLEGGKLQPVAGTPGSCQCFAFDANAAPPAPPAPPLAQVIVAGEEPAASALAAELKKADAKAEAKSEPAAQQPVTVVLTPTLTPPVLQPKKSPKPESPPDASSTAVVVVPEVLPPSPATVAEPKPEPKAEPKREPPSSRAPVAVLVTPPVPRAKSESNPAPDPDPLPAARPPVIVMLSPSMPAAPPHEPAPKPTAPTPAPQPAVQVAMLTHANETHPVPAVPKPADSSPPAESVPDYQIVMPPLRFTAGEPSGPAAPPDASPELVILIRTARVQPDYEFTGRVEPPPARMKSAALNAGAELPPQGPKNGAAKTEKKKGGFWSAFKKIFTGNS